MKKLISYSDEDLVVFAQQGDKEAYNLLLSRYNKKIVNIINFQIQDRANVSDLAQEVLIKVYKHLHYFKEKSRFSTWLYRVTQNTIKNHYRSVSWRTDLETEYADNCYPSAQLSPEYQAITIEFGEQLELAISMLSNELRICYGMYVIDGRSYEDIAKKMDCPVGTVRSRIFRARKLLMESMAQII